MSAPTPVTASSNGAVFHNLTGTISWTPASGTLPSMAITSADFTLSFERKTVTAAGAIFGEAAVNPVNEVTVEVIAYEAATTQASFLTGGANPIQFPTPMQLITIANTLVPQLDGTWNMADPPSMRLQDGDYAKFTFKLRRAGYGSGGVPSSMPVVN